MKKIILVVSIVVLAMATSVVFAEDQDFKKAALQEKMARIQAEFNLGKSMMEKAQLEYAVTQNELNSLPTKTTEDTKKKK